MNKKQIRLTESDLKQIVKESVSKILNERTYQEAMEEEYKIELDTDETDHVSTIGDLMQIIRDYV